MQHKEAQICRKNSSTQIAEKPLQLNQNDQMMKQQQTDDKSEVKTHIFQRQFNILEMGQNSSLEMNRSEKQGQDIDNHETLNMRQDYVQLIITKEENKNEEQKEEKLAEILDKYICDQILVEWQSQSGSNCQIKIQQNQVVSFEGKEGGILEAEKIVTENKQVLPQICRVNENQIPQNLVNVQQIKAKEPNNKEFKQNQPLDKKQADTINIQIFKEDRQKITVDSCDETKNKPMIWFGGVLSTLLMMLIVIILWDLETLQSVLRKFIIIGFVSAIIFLFYMERHMKNKAIQDSSLTHVN